MAGVNTRRNILIFAALLGLVTSLLIVKYLNKYKEKTSEVMVPIVVATQEIDSRTIIDGSMITVRLVRNSVAPRGAYSEEADVQGKVALRRISRDSAVAEGDVQEKGSALGLSFVIPPFMRAVTVGVDPVIGVAGFLKPGDRVDVVATFNRGDDAIARTVLQGVQLLALGSQLEKERMKSSGQDKPSSMSSGGKDTATLLVSPEEAEKLVLAENEGKLRLVLRSVQDDAKIESGGVKRATLTGGATAKPASGGNIDGRPASDHYPLSSGRAPAGASANQGRPPINVRANSASRKENVPEKPKSYEIEVIKGSKVETVEVDKENTKPTN